MTLYAQFNEAWPTNDGEFTGFRIYVFGLDKTVCKTMNSGPFWVDSGQEGWGILQDSPQICKLKIVRHFGVLICELH